MRSTNSVLVQGSAAKRQITCAMRIFVNLDQYFYLRPRHRSVGFWVLR